MFGNDRFHGQRGVHPHRNLEAGRTTLNAEMGKLLAKSLVQKGEFDKDDYLAKYIEYMLSRQVTVARHTGGRTCSTLLCDG